MQAVIISGSLEMGSINQSSYEGVALREPREVTLIPPTLHVIHSPNRVERHPDIAKLAPAERKKPLPPDRILLNSYRPLRSSAPAMEEVTIPGPEDIKHILHH